MLLERVQQFLRSRAPDTLLTQDWDRFYSTYNVVLRRVACAANLPADEIPDLVQIVWTEVIARLPEFHWDANRPGLRAWMITLVRRKAINLIRRRARPADRHQSIEAAAACVANSDSDPVILWIRRWRRELVHTVLDELRRKISAANYRLLQLRFVEGRNIEETAQALGLTEKQVRSRQNRLFHKLQPRLALLRGDGFGQP